MNEPLRKVTSIKLKLGLLVAISVLFAVFISTAAWIVGVAWWMTIPVTVGLALAVTQILASGMTAPLSAMTDASRRMASGEYDVRVQTPSTDEIGELADAFNKMAADLGSVDTQRRDLLAMVSHEVRTPLAALTALLENLDDGVAPTNPESISVALGQTRQLTALVSDLLDLSRLEAGHAHLDLTSFPIRELIDEAVSQAANSPRDVTFEVRCDPPDLRVRADARRLHQLLTNLLDNAARHSPAGGKVRIYAHQAAECWELSVSDQGPGIDAADRQRIFQRFGTAPGSGGTGLGLAIASWVVSLHGGQIASIDPLPGEPGARLRATFPTTFTPPEASASSTVPTSSLTMESSVTHPSGQNSAPPPPVKPPAKLAANLTANMSGPPSRGLIDGLFGGAWPDRGIVGNKAVLLATVGIGVLAALVIPFHKTGLAATVVLLLSAALVFSLSPHRRSPYTLTCVGICVAMALVVTLRAAEWVQALAVLTGALVATGGLVRARTWSGILFGAIAWPIAAVRGLPWVARGLRSASDSKGWAAIIRTTLIATAALVTFGFLFSSADAIFRSWLGEFIPSLGFGLVARVFVGCFVTTVVLAACYLSLNPPGADVEVSASTPTKHRYEWLAPVLVLDGLFLTFIAAQAAAYFGGNDYVQRSTGLTYAAYVHQGFGQLVVITALTLAVVSIVVRKASRETAADRLWLRASIGMLCALTLFVVASAMRRMDLYQDAYGFTRLRLLVDAFAGWLGLIVVAVIVAGLLWKGWWIPRFALLSGAGILLVLFLINPDGYIAQHNIDRAADVTKVDTGYLSALSEDAAPAISKLPAAQRGCAMSEIQYGYPNDDVFGWNYGRARAAKVTKDATVCDQWP